MKTGIIFTFYNQENKINRNELFQFMKDNDNIHLCLINNGSTDNTLLKLEELKNAFPNKITLGNIRAHKGRLAALRIGFRILTKSQKIDTLAFSSEFNGKQINKLASLYNS
ncbi:glycosyltransferase involved in cell wall biosynthesis [Saonia flava]|uniref:Glycosyltransferase involved in cell wall biosynthesis n=1 Tax=Saonia flava TaxID=523696 RepID=A0A846QPV6_9FLAO|nr:hypothetical protein [Saonia flava]NJB70138.1 glycosyltransferase involved in cell wall biosynthesis [Saonia flava]